MVSQSFIALGFAFDGLSNAEWRTLPDEVQEYSNRLVRRIGRAVPGVTPKSQTIDMEALPNLSPGITFKPNRGMAILGPDPRERWTKSVGEILTPQGSSKPAAIIVALGPPPYRANGEEEEPVYEVGDRVFFSIESGSVSKGGDGYLMVAVSNILTAYDEDRSRDVDIQSK